MGISSSSQAYSSLASAQARPNIQLSSPCVVATPNVGCSYSALSPWLSPCSPYLESVGTNSIGPESAARSTLPSVMQLLGLISVSPSSAVQSGSPTQTQTCWALYPSSQAPLRNRHQKKEPTGGTTGRTAYIRSAPTPIFVKLPPIAQMARPNVALCHQRQRQRQLQLRPHITGDGGRTHLQLQLQLCHLMASG